MVPAYDGSLSIRVTVGGVNGSSISNVILEGFTLIVGNSVSVMQVFVTESRI